MCIYIYIYIDGPNMVSMGVLREYSMLPNSWIPEKHPHPNQHATQKGPSIAMSFSFTKTGSDEVPCVIRGG